MDASFLNSRHKIDVLVLRRLNTSWVFWSHFKMLYKMLFLTLMNWSCLVVYIIGTRLNSCIYLITHFWKWLKTVRSSLCVFDFFNLVCKLIITALWCTIICWFTLGASGSKESSWDETLVWKCDLSLFEACFK